MCYLIKTLHATFLANIYSYSRLICSFLLRYMILIGILTQINFCIPEVFKTNVKNKITFWICVNFLWIHIGYFVVKKWCDIFVLKSFCVQKHLRHSFGENLITYSKHRIFQNTYFYITFVFLSIAGIVYLETNKQTNK